MSQPRGEINLFLRVIHGDPKDQIEHLFEDVPENKSLQEEDHGLLGNSRCATGISITCRNSAAATYTNAFCMIIKGFQYGLGNTGFEYMFDRRSKAFVVQICIRQHFPV